MGAEWVLYDPESRDLHVLNLSGALIWSLLDGERTLDEVAEMVVEEVADDPEPAQVLVDGHAAVASFRASGLLA